MLVLSGAPCGFGFALLGPINEAYQQPVIAHALAGDIGAVKNLGEEYRRNFPVYYYAFDEPFLVYFGSNGVVAVEEAIAILNALTNFTHYSQDLSEFPLEATGENYRAAAVRLLDLKSTALSFLVEAFGLAEPDRFTWTLRDRRNQPGLPCPFMIYNVIKRNFDPVTWEPTSYVNGVLYSYLITEICTGPDPLADAFEFPVDPLERNQFSAVASFITAATYGAFWTGLTRDDVGGFRYLYRTNNLNFEIASPDSILFATNANTFQLLFTSNLTQFVNQSLTNNAAQLQALYPDLVIASTTPIFTNLVSTNVFFYLTNHPWSPPGAVSVAFQTNLVTNVVTWFSHTFGNVVTNTYYTNGFINVVNTSVGPRPFGSPGQLYTNTTMTTVFTNFVNGDYYILPINSACGVSIVATQLVTVTSLTNAPVTATNVVGATNVNGQSFAQELVFYFTNSVFVINPVPCVTNSLALRQGMDRFKFVRTSYDSLVGRFYEPITNEYTLVAVTNFQPVVQRLQRRLVTPDVLFTAEERQVPDQAWLGVGFRTDIDGSGGFDTNGIAPPPAGQVYGPGTIQSPIVIEFNKVGPLLINIYNPAFIFNGLSELTGSLPIGVLNGGPGTNFVWASYDSSTNAPIIYPNHLSIVDLENQVLFGVATAGLPRASVGLSYNQQLQTYGGGEPITWSLAPTSPGLPPGLTLSPTGVIFGTPTTAGIYDFTVRASESGGRTGDRALELIIN